MARFLVKLKQGRGRPSILAVEADYVKLEPLGHVVFRNASTRKTYGYPETVRMFAPGTWLEVCRDTGELTHIPPWENPKPPLTE